jgi:hypothetical protein
MKVSTTKRAWGKITHRKNPTSEEYALLLQNPASARVLSDTDLAMVTGGYGGPGGWRHRGDRDWDDCDDGYRYGGRGGGRNWYGGFRHTRRGWW